MRLFLNSLTPLSPEKVISPELFGRQKWFTYQNVGNFICYRYMRLFSNSNGMQVPYAPIFDGRLLLGMSLFSKKYSTAIRWDEMLTSLLIPRLIRDKLGLTTWCNVKWKHGTGWDTLSQQIEWFNMEFQTIQCCKKLVPRKGQIIFSLYTLERV